LQQFDVSPFWNEDGDGDRLPLAHSRHLALAESAILDVVGEEIMRPL
jgi:hypothetical protein